VQVLDRDPFDGIHAFLPQRERMPAAQESHGPVLCLEHPLSGFARRFGSFVFAPVPGLSLRGLPCLASPGGSSQLFPFRQGLLALSRENRRIGPSHALVPARNSTRFLRPEEARLAVPFFLAHGTEKDSSLDRTRQIAGYRVKSAGFHETEDLAFLETGFRPSIGAGLSPAILSCPTRGGLPSRWPGGGRARRPARSPHPRHERRKIREPAMVSPFFHDCIRFPAAQS